MKKNPKSIADSVIDSAKTTAIIETMRSNNASNEEIAAAVLSPEDWGVIARDIMITLDLLCRMGWAIGLPRVYGIDGNQAFLGKAHLAQHYPDTVAAKEYAQMWENSKTVRDVWEFFLRSNDLPDDVLVNRPGYDHVYVQCLMAKEIGKERVKFGLNREDSERGADS